MLGQPEPPGSHGDLVRACKGCYDGAKAYGVPFISGKDSLNNEYMDGITGLKTSIPPTLLISAVGIVPDVRLAVTMDLKHAGNLVYAIGVTTDEMGGSHYYRTQNAIGANAPQPVTAGLETARAIHQAIAARLVEACHDCSEGGWAVALAEMSLAGGLGMNAHLSRAPGASALPDDVTCCFSESNGRYAIEVTPDNAAAFEEIMREHPTARIGTVTEEPRFVVLGLHGDVVISAAVSELERVWRGECDADRLAAERLTEESVTHD